MFERVSEGVVSAGSSDWVDQIRAGIAGLLEYLAENPLSVRTGIVEAFGAGPRARDRYRQAVGAFSRSSMPDARWPISRTGYRARSPG